MGLFDIFDDDEPQLPAPIPIPKRKTADELAREALAGYQQTAGGYYKTGREFLPQYADLFSDIEAETAPRRQELYTDIERQTRPKMIDIALSGLKQADPTGFLISEEVKQRVLTNLRSGGAFTDEESRLFDQGIQSRLLKQGRGAGVGDAYSAERLMAGERFNRERSRIQDAYNVMNNNPQMRIAGMPFNAVGGTNVTNLFDTGPSGSDLFSAGMQQNDARIRDKQAMNADSLNRFALGREYTTPSIGSQILGFAGGVGSQLAGAYLSSQTGGLAGPSMMGPNYDTFRWAAPKGVNTSSYNLFG